MKLVTALATPFKNGKVDFSCYERLLEKQKNIADELLCCGTTGEEGMLSPKERCCLIKITKSVGLPVWVGVSGATQDALVKTEIAKRCGADGVLVSPPSFFKCTKEGFVEHVKRILDKGLQVMLYNAPSRCGYELWEDTVMELSQYGVSLKDAGGKIEYAKKLHNHVPLFCGNDDKLQEYAALGSSGCVSVVSNAFPKLTRAIMHQTDDSTMLASFNEISKLAFCQLNPIPIKYLLFKLNVFDTCEMRLPLTAANVQTKNAIDNFLQSNAEVCLQELAP